MAVPLWGLANWFRLAVPAAWAWALGLHLFSWFAQIVFGHQMAEHRRPALLDSFFQVRVGGCCGCVGRWQPAAAVGVGCRAKQLVMRSQRSLGTGRPAALLFINA